MCRSVWVDFNLQVDITEDSNVFRFDPNRLIITGDTVLSRVSNGTIVFYICDLKSEPVTIKVQPVPTFTGSLRGL
jgi:hypothetical protein